MRLKKNIPIYNLHIQTIALRGQMQQKNNHSNKYNMEPKFCKLETQLPTILERKKVYYNISFAQKLKKLNSNNTSFFLFIFFFKGWTVIKVKKVQKPNK